MNKKVVLLNGPPASGKDAAAEFLCKALNGSHREFKHKLFELTKAIYCVDDITWASLYTREKKEIPTDILDGLSPRQALIKVSEEAIKPNFGKDYFGKAAAKELQPGLNIFSDSGFIEELIPIEDAVGLDNLLVIRIHRPGYTFEGDSRRYLNDKCCKWQLDIHNDSALDQYLIKVCFAVEDWLSGGVHERNWS